ncbi:uncharacterized protein F5147DRAFT_785013 [Suillus discolor]|uniref:Uncharacterized protein n=1 Tax=Suillus discolor TaxID=1912936 RepID=A0A9P7EQI8_9AGAM|nr:uncharacterized protein F5147DRAFT_785013 [Suillus discolor]KAG2079507.1 hypothetical protein F5147DRAFT_785013 [Suillus discolor]
MPPTHSITLFQPNPAIADYAGPTVKQSIENPGHHAFRHTANIQNTHSVNGNHEADYLVLNGSQFADLQGTARNVVDFVPNLVVHAHFAAQDVISQCGNVLIPAFELPIDARQIRSPTPLAFARRLTSGPFFETYGADVKRHMRQSTIPLPIVDFDDFTHMSPEDIFHMPGLSDPHSLAVPPSATNYDLKMPAHVASKFMDFHEETLSRRTSERDAEEKDLLTTDDYDKRRKSGSVEHVLPTPPKTPAKAPAGDVPSQDALFHQALIVKTWLVALEKSSTTLAHSGRDAHVADDVSSDGELVDMSETSSSCADDEESLAPIPNSTRPSSRIVQLHLSHIRKLAEDIADPWTRKFIPQLIPSLIFTRTTDALEEPDDNGLFDKLTPSPFGLRQCELTYETLPFHGHYDHSSVHRLTTLTRFLTGIMASQSVRELGIEQAAFHTTRPSAIYHYDTSTYNLHVPRGTSRLHTRMYELKNMRTTARNIIQLTHATLTPFQSQECSQEQLLLIVVDGVRCIPASVNRATFFHQLCPSANPLFAYEEVAYLRSAAGLFRFFGYFVLADAIDDLLQRSVPDEDIIFILLQNYLLDDLRGTNVVPTTSTKFILSLAEAKYDRDYDAKRVGPYYLE